MTRIIAYSGGAASAAMTILLTQHSKDYILLFHDTKTEPKDNYRFRSEVSEYVGIPITEQSDGRDIWQVFDDNKMIGSNRTALCSRILKIEQSQKFLKQFEQAEVYLGYTVEEWRRAQRMVARQPNNVTYKFPLIDWKITKRDAKRIVTDCAGIRLPEMYKRFEHANCLPCVRGGLAYWGIVALHYPEAYEKAAKYERKYGYTILHRDYGFLDDLSDRAKKAAEKWLAKKRFAEQQGDLFDAPCICHL